uniref:Uncharacterized protein n=1 Tax=Entomoneis paludosa TaxID=265537 RepID=A0A7S2Y9U9_9STRA|mmetsp:Transcript_24102/g.50121  ORF Transcript_24102/g.50121 Transcript_24102/m.50121 type:complete len:136 (+) Transcript_24102:41-448(+)
MSSPYPTPSSIQIPQAEPTSLSGESPNRIRSDSDTLTIESADNLKQSSSPPKAPTSDAGTIEATVTSATLKNFADVEQGTSAHTKEETSATKAETANVPCIDVDRSRIVWWVLLFFLMIAAPIVVGWGVALNNKD